MGSKAKKTKTRRALTKASRGRKRKNSIRQSGTTPPNLALNVPNANEKAQQAKTGSSTDGQL